jgi:hypothetical protein
LDELVIYGATFSLFETAAAVDDLVFLEAALVVAPKTLAPLEPGTIYG